MAVTHYRPDGGSNGWLRHSFLLPPGGMSDAELRLREYPNGSFKFAETSIGGNQCINPPPQFTHFADLNEVRIADSPNEQYEFTNAGRGMGRWYSENIDDPTVVAHFRFGVPIFNSMTRFFGNFYNTSASRLVRTGRGDGLAFTLGRIAGFVATIQIQPYLLLGRTLRFLMDMPSTKYCYLKPTMHTYHAAVSNILTKLAADQGFITGQSNSERDFKVENNSDFTPGEGMDRLLPTAYRSDGSLNTYAIFTRYQRLANRRHAALVEANNVSGSPDAVIAAVRKIYQDPKFSNQDYPPRYKNLDQYLGAYFGTNAGQDTGPTVAETPAGATAPTAEELAARPDYVKSYTSETQENLLGSEGEPDEGFWSFLKSELHDGGQFVSFRIENPGTSGESFNNSVKESMLAEKMNSMSSGARSTRFNMADGQVMGGAIGSILGSITDAVTAFVGGVGDSVGISGLGAVMGNAMADIPKYWDGSTADLPKTTFTMSLQAWSGDPLTRYQSLMVPLAMILAAALPRSTGYQSYGAPFMLEYYCKGRSNSRYAVIDSLQITRGTGNVGFTEDGKPLAIDITFTVADLSTIMHMPITAAFSPTQLLSSSGLSKLLFSDTSSFTDYLATLSSVGLVDQVYTTRRLKRNFHASTLAFKDWSSWANAASWASNSGFLFGAAPGRWVSAAFSVTDRG